MIYLYSMRNSDKVNSRKDFASFLVKTKRRLYGEINIDVLVMAENNVIEYPFPELGKETYKQYHERVKTLKAQGFLLTTLTERDHSRYCIGAGCRDSIDENELMKN